MKKLLLIVFTFLFFTVGNAMALPWVMNTINTFEDDDAEELYYDANGNGLLDIGDKLRGVMEWNALTYPQSPEYSLPGNGIELTGVFEIEVTEKTFYGNQTVDADGDNSLDSPEDFKADFYSYTFGPSSSFQAELGLGTSSAVSAFYLDDSPDLDVQSDDPTNAYTNAMNGDLYWTFGIEDSSTDDGDGADWHIEAAPEDIGIFADVASQVTVAETDIGLHYLSDFGIGPELLPFTFGAFDDIELWAEFTLEGTRITNNDGSFTSENTTEFDLLSNAQAKVLPTPEPATMVLLGIGLLGAAAITRRRCR